MPRPRVMEGDHYRFNKSGNIVRVIAIHGKEAEVESVISGKVMIVPLRSLSKIEEEEEVDLRDLWPSLSPRKRDARVAQALGLHLYAWIGPLSGPFGGRSLSVHSKPVKSRSGLQPTLWSSFKEEEVNGSLLRYATAWEDSGPLLDRLGEEGWTIVLRASPTHGWDVMEATKGGLHFWCESDSGPATIALAFCLAMDAKEKP